VAYLGLGNRLGIVEPHYRLPFLSWLPRRLADRYVRAAGRGDFYFEQFRTRRGLRALTAGLYVLDYTSTVIAEPERFAAEDMVPAPLRRVPTSVLRRVVGGLMPIVPTFIW